MALHKAPNLEPLTDLINAVNEKAESALQAAEALNHEIIQMRIVGGVVVKGDMPDGWVMTQDSAAGESRITHNLGVELFPSIIAVDMPSNNFIVMKGTTTDYFEWGTVHGDSGLNTSYIGDVTIWIYRKL